MMAQVGALGDELKASEARLVLVLEDLNAILATLPNPRRAYRSVPTRPPMRVEALGYAADL